MIMGNQTTTKKFLKLNPICCFCGGETPATGRDHVPSIQLFTLKQRPHGMEVPACDYCNGVTSQAEQIVAMLSRASPGPKTPEEAEECKEIFQAVANNHPDVLIEMKSSPVQRKRVRKFGSTGDPINVRGPLVNQAIGQFSRKLILAAHYTITGNIVPKSTGIGVVWTTNFQIMTKGLPEEMLKHLGPARTLKQGNWGVEDQFFLRYGFTELGNMGLYYASFREAFVVQGTVNPDKEFLNSLNMGFVFDVFDSQQ